jgi:hypothetical protein
MANAFGQPTTNTSAFVPSVATSQLLTQGQDPYWSTIGSYLEGGRRKRGEQEAFKQAQADKATALEAASEQQKFENKYKTDTLAAVQAKADKPKSLAEQGFFIDSTTGQQFQGVQRDGAVYQPVPNEDGSMSFIHNPNANEVAKTETGAKGQSSLTTGATTSAQNKQVASQISNLLIDRVEEQLKGLDDSFFTYEGKIESGAKSLISKSGIASDIAGGLGLEPLDKKARARYTQANANIMNMKSSVIQSRSGAAVTEQEAKRFDEILPDISGVFSFDSREEAMGKMKEFRAYAQKVQDRYDLILNNNPTLDPVKDADTIKHMAALMPIIEDEKPATPAPKRRRYDPVTKTYSEQ